MAGLAEVLLLTFAAGLAIPMGGLLAHVEHLRPGHFRADLLAGITAFGGGALLSAVVLVLVPDGLAKAGPGVTLTAFILGGLGALAIAHTARRMGTKAGQLIAMLMDFAPESLVLGAAAATGNGSAVLLALLIGLQNLPEGFGSYRDLCDGHDAKWGRRVGLGLLAAMALLGPAAGLGGYLWLEGHPVVEAGVLMAASGGILALVFDQIAPHAHRADHPAPTVGMIVGFSLGLLGHVLIT